MKTFGDLLSDIIALYKQNSEETIENSIEVVLFTQWAHIIKNISINEMLQKALEGSKIIGIKDQTFQVKITNANARFVLEMNERYITAQIIKEVKKISSCVIEQEYKIIFLL